MTDKIDLLVGVGLLSFGVVLLFEEDTTQTAWTVLGALLLGLGVVMVSIGTKNWLHARRELKASRSPK